MSVNNVSPTHTATACSQLSRNELLAWVNRTLQSKFTKVDELCTGAAYCQMMDLLFPKVVPLKRVKFFTNLEHEFIDNYKILQMVFQRLNVQKAIPIDRLVRGKFQDNIEFLQWFKRFYDANYELKFYDPISARNGQPMGYGSPALKKKSLKTISSINKPSSKMGIAPPPPHCGVIGGGGVGDGNNGGQRTYRKESPTKQKLIQNNEINHQLKRSLTRTELRHNHVNNGGTHPTIGGYPNLNLPVVDMPLIQLYEKNTINNLYKKSTEFMEYEKKKWQQPSSQLISASVDDMESKKLERILACCEEAKAKGQVGIEINIIMHIILGKADRPPNNELDQLGAGDCGAEDTDAVEQVKLSFSRGRV